MCSTWWANKVPQRACGVGTVLEVMKVLCTVGAARLPSKGLAVGSMDMNASGPLAEVNHLDDIDKD